jgi:hypothetical protein
MSGNDNGGGGIIIIGDEAVAKVRKGIADGDVNPKMVAVLERIIEQYEDNPATITAQQQAFFFNCVMQIVYVTTP